ELDSKAPTELVYLPPGHHTHAHGIRATTAASNDEERQETFRSWWEADVLAGLRRLREECISLTPVEMITALADALDLPELIRSWSTPDQRLRTLDALRRAAAGEAGLARAAWALLQVGAA